MTGIESESGYPTDLPREAAIRQQEFIAYLRKERQRKIASQGPMTRRFEGWGYSTAAVATASFMALCTGLTDTTRRPPPFESLD